MDAAPDTEDFRRAGQPSMKDAAFRDHIANLKAAVSCLAVAADLNLRGRGKRFFCPACQEDGARHSTPDLSVTDDGFKCFKCGQYGDQIDLAVLARGMTKSEAIAYLESLAGVRRPNRQAPRGQILGRRKVANQGFSIAASAVVLCRHERGVRQRPRRATWGTVGRIGQTPQSQDGRTAAA